MKTFNATELIPLNKEGHRIKKVRHFLDNGSVPFPDDMPKPTRGRGAHTDLPISLLGEFLLWLTPKTRKAVLDGVPLKEIMDNVKEYW